MQPAERPAPARADAPIADKVLVCRTCVRRLGPEGRAMRLALRRALETSRWGRVRLVDTGCFSLCPPRGVVLSTVPKVGGRRLMVLAPGAETDAALDYLLRPTPAAPGRS